MTAFYYFVTPFLCIFITLNFIALWFPKIVIIKRSILIKGDVKTIFKEVSDLRNFITWDPWSKRDPNIQQKFSGPESGIDSKYEWSGNKKVKTGYMRTIKIDDPTFVEQELVFGKGNPAKASFELSEENDQVSVSWTTALNLGAFPLSRLFGPMIKKMIGKDFEDGLQNLKQKIEQ